MVQLGKFLTRPDQNRVGLSRIFFKLSRVWVYQIKSDTGSDSDLNKVNSFDPSRPEYNFFTLNILILLYNYIKSGCIRIQVY